MFVSPPVMEAHDFSRWKSHYTVQRPHRVLDGQTLSEVVILTLAFLSVGLLIEDISHATVRYCPAR